MTNDQERLLFISFMMRDWPEAGGNRYVSFTKEETLAVGNDNQKFVGYQLSESFVGWVRVRM
jgi:hypothetical protein